MDVMKIKAVYSSTLLYNLWLWLFNSVFETMTVDKVVGIVESALS